LNKLKRKEGIMFECKPFEKRRPDTQYKKLLRRILKSGDRVMPQQEEPAIMVFGHQMRFDLRNGFPIITERDLLASKEGHLSQAHMAIGELCAFLNGARTLDEMRRFGCGWWSRWVTPEKCAKRGLETGDLGPGSYGAAFHDFPTAEGKPFNQIQHLVEQITELPHLRTHFVSPWIPQYAGRGKGKAQKVVVCPCHGWFHAMVYPNTGEISLHHFQRSADAPVGLVFNFIQYAALLMMLAQISGYKPRELVYTISDAHIYLSQMSDVGDILATPPGRFPTMEINPDIKNIFDFRPEHFKASDYHPSLPGRRIWTPV
jgi:thymidylate synthase